LGGDVEQSVQGSRVRSDVKIEEHEEHEEECGGCECGTSVRGA